MSYPLVSKLKRVTRNSHLFFPAHNFRSLLAESGFSRRGHGLKVGFWGFINNRINIDWIVTATRLDKALEFYFCGPVELSDHKIEFLSHPNIHFQKSCQGDEAVKFLKQMDVLIMPYVLMESVLAITANNKLFFYLAAGKPIVISNMPNFMRFERGIIYVAKSSEDFVKEIRRAFNEDCEGLVGRRLQIAAQNTWKVRGEELMKHIESSPQTY